MQIFKKLLIYGTSLAILAISLSKRRKNTKKTTRQANFDAQFASNYTGNKTQKVT